MDLGRDPGADCPFPFGRRDICRDSRVMLKDCGRPKVLAGIHLARVNRVPDLIHKVEVPVEQFSPIEQPHQFAPVAEDRGGGHYHHPAGAFGRRGRLGSRRRSKPEVGSSGEVSALLQQFFPGHDLGTSRHSPACQYLLDQSAVGLAVALDCRIAGPKQDLPFGVGQCEDIQPLATHYLVELRA